MKWLTVLSLAFIVCIIWITVSDEPVNKNFKFALFIGAVIVLLLPIYHLIFVGALEELATENRSKKHLIALAARLCEKEVSLDIIIDELCNREPVVIELILRKLSDSKREQLTRRLVEKMTEAEELLKQIESNPNEWNDYENLILEITKDLSYLKMLRNCFEW